MPWVAHFAPVCFTNFLPPSLLYISILLPALPRPVAHLLFNREVLPVVRGGLAEVIFVSFFYEPLFCRKLWSRSLRTFLHRRRSPYMRAPYLNRGQRDTKSTHTYMHTDSPSAFGIDTQGPWAQGIPSTYADVGKMILETPLDLLSLTPVTCDCT